MRLYVIRHGRPNYEIDSLTERGFVEADLLGEALKGIPFDGIYASTHGRAIKTSLPTCKHHGVDYPILADWAREDTGAKYFAKIYFDPKQGKKIFQWHFWIPTDRKLFTSDELLAYGDNWFDHPHFKDTKLKEGVMLMRRSCDQWMLSLGYKHDRQTKVYKRVKETPNNIALFAHGAFALSFLSALLDIPYNAFTTQYDCMDCTGYAIVDFDGDICKPKLVAYNVTDHLRGEEAESKFKEVGV